MFTQFQYERGNQQNYIFFHFYLIFIGFVLNRRFFIVFFLLNWKKLIAAIHEARYFSTQVLSNPSSLYAQWNAPHKMPFYSAADSSSKRYNQNNNNNQAFVWCHTAFHFPTNKNAGFAHIYKQPLLLRTFSLFELSKSQKFTRTHIQWYEIKSSMNANGSHSFAFKWRKKISVVRIQLTE